MIKKFFKRIGRAIKKGFKKIGKFIGKLGIVGQIGLMMFLPAIGGALMKGLGNVAGKLIAGNSGILKGVGHVLKGAHSFVQGGVNAFRTVTEGVTSFVSEFTKTAANKLGFNVSDAAPDFFGKGGAWERVQEGIVENAKSILDPFRSNITITQGMQDSLIKDQTNIDIVSRNTGLSKDMLTRLNPDSAFKVGDVINVDVATIQPIPNGEIITGLDGGDQILRQVKGDVQPDKELGLELEKGPNINETIFKPKDNIIPGEYDVLPQEQFDNLLKDNVTKKPSYLDLSMPDSVKPESSSIIANKPVEAASANITKVTEEKGVVDAIIDKTTGIIPEPIKKGFGQYKKGMEFVTTASSLLGTDQVGGGYSYGRGPQLLPPADMVITPQDQSFFGVNNNIDSFINDSSAVYGTPTTFENSNVWSSWLDTNIMGAATATR
jgi:hypothetical protein